MTDAQLNEIEAALGRELPADYRHFVRTCPDQVWRRYCSYLYTSPKVMIRENQTHPQRCPDSDVRESDGAGGARQRPWPTEWTIIGDGDSEWYTFLRPDAPGIWEWQHDTQEIAQVAPTFEEFLDRQREKIGPPPVLEVTQHPMLGELIWNPERRIWRAEVAGVPVYLKPWNDNRDSFLAVASSLVVPAIEAEPSVFATAMTGGGWTEFLEWTDGDDHGLTASTVRTRMGPPTVTVQAGPKVEYQYQPASELNFIAFWVVTDASLNVTEQGWVR